MALLPLNTKFKGPAPPGGKRISQLLVELHTVTKQKVYFSFLRNLYYFLLQIFAEKL